MVPRSISPTMASCEISRAIRGSRKMVRLDRLTMTTSRPGLVAAAAEEGEGEGEGREEERRGQDPPVPQALLDLHGRRSGCFSSRLLRAKEVGVEPVEVGGTTSTSSTGAPSPVARRSTSIFWSGAASISTMPVDLAPFAN